MLRYEPGEEYQRHHDYVPRVGVPEPAGPRLLTMFLYFSDVEAGGATGLPTVTPNVTPGSHLPLHVRRDRLPYR